MMALWQVKLIVFLAFLAGGIFWAVILEKMDQVIEALYDLKDETEGESKWE